jgi:3-phenylpropionate/trans-cinnamate dioxygenase ferredoxin subunit
MADSWQRVGSTSDITDDQPLSAQVGERYIGVYRLGDDYYALEDICPHAEALLSQGFVEGEEIECPLHGARFHIPSGRCTQEPGGRDLHTYPIKIEDGMVFVKVPE